MLRGECCRVLIRRTGRGQIPFGLYLSRNATAPYGKCSGIVGTTRPRSLATRGLPTVAGLDEALEEGEADTTLPGYVGSIGKIL